MGEPIQPIQKILFGSPGTGKSYKIQKIAQEQLDIELDDTSNTLENTIKTVFHPEYTYADFMGKLMPQSQGDTIIYKFYPGHFLRILGLAYRNILGSNNKKALLVIDELNRGNAAAIFGTVFQLLDRAVDNWSSYEVDLSDLELMSLLRLIGYEPKLSLDTGEIMIGRKSLAEFCSDKEEELVNALNGDGAKLMHLLKDNKISLPPNLSILATINTSDESIYYLDSAFKRRWDWEYIEAPRQLELAPEALKEIKLIVDESTSLDWTKCIAGLNQFIRSHHHSIRRIEDKQIGWWFVKPKDGEVQLQQVQDKLMFYLWDNVFAKDRRPLKQALEKQLKGTIELITFADFVKHTEAFLQYIELSYDTTF